MYSPLQMAADLPENYDAHPDAFKFIEEVPVDWDDTKIVEAEPGEFLTIARKEKGKANWYIGSITGADQRVATIPMDFLDEGKEYICTIYADAKDADWKNNPMAYSISEKQVDKKTVLSIEIAPGGGAAFC
jgi:hypothetical protein